jgi:hypothetical protein
MNHLLFHIWPKDTPAGQKCLRWHLRQLEKYLHLFDGQLAFAILTGDGLAPPDTVQKLLPRRAHIITRPNDPAFGEACTLPMLLAKTFSLAPEDSLFYAHTKGMSHLGTSVESPTRWWSLAMYEYLLATDARTLLAQHPFVGWLKYEGPHGMFPPWSTWHFAGNFWWARAAHLYRRAWWNVHPTPMGAEAFPSSLAGTEQAAARHTYPWNLLQRPDGLGVMYFVEFWREFGIPMGRDADSYD